MAQFYAAKIVNGGVQIYRNKKIEKAEAIKRIKRGDDVWGTKRNAHTLAEALSDGQGDMRHAAHVAGGYQHYHDIHHRYNGHIFYGEPH